LIFHG